MPDLDPGAVWLVAADLDRLAEWCPGAVGHIRVEDWSPGAGFRLVMPGHSQEAPTGYVFHVAGVPHEATVTLRYEGPLGTLRKMVVRRELVKALQQLERLARAQ